MSTKRFFVKVAKNAVFIIVLHFHDCSLLSVYFILCNNTLLLYLAHVLLLVHIVSLGLHLTIKLTYSLILSLDSIKVWVFILSIGIILSIQISNLFLWCFNKTYQSFQLSPILQNVCIQSFPVHGIILHWNMMLIGEICYSIHKVVFELGVVFSTCSSHKFFSSACKKDLVQFFWDSVWVLSLIFIRLLAKIVDDIFLEEIAK